MLVFFSIATRGWVALLYRRSSSSWGFEKSWLIVDEWLEYLGPEVIEVPWQGGPLHVWIRLPSHVRVIGVVRWVVVVLPRKVEVICKVSEMFAVS